MTPKKETNSPPLLVAGHTAAPTPTSVIVPTPRAPFGEHNAPNLGHVNSDGPPATVLRSHSPSRFVAITKTPVEECLPGITESSSIWFTLCRLAALGKPPVVRIPAPPLSPLVTARHALAHPSLDLAGNADSVVPRGLRTGPSSPVTSHVVTGSPGLLALKN